jgi:argininosuccinate lyase
VREAALTALAKLNDLREALLRPAEANRDAIVPAYTWGVQAQPISFGH